MTKNEAREKVVAELQAIIDTELPHVMHDTIKRLIEVIVVLQGQIEGNTDILIDHETRIRRLEKQT